MIGARYGWYKNIITRHKSKYSEYEQDMATIVGLELEMTLAISGGHKASDSDKFKQHRETLKQLREKHNLKRRAQ